VLSGDAGARQWTVEVWEDSKTGRSPFASWFENLDEYDQIVVTTVIEKIVKRLGIDVCDTEWGKNLGGSLYEVRIRRPLSNIVSWGEPDTFQVPDDLPPDESVLLRLYCTFHGDRIVLFVSGYDKGKDPSSKREQREINTARKHIRAWKAER